MITRTVAEQWDATTWVLPDGHTVTRHGIWASVRGPALAPATALAGWKLHVSARPETLRATVETLTPLLFEAGCEFKVIASSDLLRELNCGLYGAAAVGKAITVYPHPDAVAELGRALAAALVGRQAPRIASDRAVRADAPVYYRYGPIAAQWRTDEGGNLDVSLTAPDGSVISGAAGDEYRAPDWADDPFGPGSSAAGAPCVLAGTYRITAGISRTHRGTVLRAIDESSGRPVIVKQAKAWVDESGDGDARAYLRNERRVLAALAGVAGVPEVVDHLAYGEDEYLVTTDLGPVDLRSDLVARGVFATDPAAGRSLATLARVLLARLDAVHARGVVMRDLAPKNVVVLGEGDWGLIDFEISALDGEQRYGWTAGYSDPGQRRRAAARLEDDYYSLGATLFHAVTGMDPVVMDTDDAVNRDRTLAALRAVIGAGTGVELLIGELLSPDIDTRAAAVQHLRTQGLPGHGPRAAASAAPAVAAMSGHTLAAVLDHVRDHITDDPSAAPMTPTPFAGLAGVLAELAHHPSAARTLRALAHVTGQLARTVDMQPGLAFGRMGTALALQQAADALGTADLLDQAAAVLPDKAVVETENRVDFTHGLAGLGVGYLALADRADDPAPLRALAASCVRRVLQIDLDAALAELPSGQPGHGISVADGFAHGRAGVAYLLLAYAARTGDPAATARARELTESLRLVVPSLAAQAASPTGRPMSGSWCQGLAGIGSTLVRAAHYFADDALLDSARVAAQGCLAIAPRVPLVTQCCGLAGIGEFLLDLAVVSGDQQPRRAARDVLGLMLTRSGGTATAPTFPDSTLAGHEPAWATGTAGVLSFLRRLLDPAAPRLWLADVAALLPTAGVTR